MAGRASERSYLVLVLLAAAAALTHPGAVAADPVVIGYGTDPSLVFTSANGDFVVAFSPDTDQLPDGSEAPFLRRILASGADGGPLGFPVGSELKGLPWGAPWLEAAGAPGPFWAARVRRVGDGNPAGLLIAAYGADGSAPEARPLELRPAEGITLWAPRIAVQRTTNAAAGDALFVNYDTYALDEDEDDPYLASYLQELLSPSGRTSGPKLISEMPGTPAFRGSRLQPVAGTETGQVFMMGLAIESQRPSKGSLHFHEVLVTGEVMLDSDKGVLRDLDRPGRLQAATETTPAPLVHLLNGHSVGDQGVIDIDRSAAAARGRLWVAYAVNPNPSTPTLDQGDIRLARSDDKARTWTLDGAGTPLKPLPLAVGKTQFFPMLDVDDNGWIHVAYYQNETGAVADGVLDASLAHVYYTASKDNGASWRPPVRVSDEASGLQYDDTPGSKRMPFLGSRQELGVLATDGGTTVRICWARPEGARAQVVCAAVTEPFCGDGARDRGEVCDDGNTVSGDCCSAICRAETGAVCDDHSLCTEGDTCSALGTCTGTGVPASRVPEEAGGDPMTGACEGLALPRRVARSYDKWLRWLRQAARESRDQQICAEHAATRLWVASKKQRLVKKKLGPACAAHLAGHFRRASDWAECLMTANGSRKGGPKRCRPRGGG